MKKTRISVLIFALLLVVAGLAYLAVVDIPAPQEPREKVIQHADYIR